VADKGTASSGELLSPNDLARCLSRSPTFAAALISGGTIPSFRLKGLRRVRNSDCRQLHRGSPRREGLAWRHVRSPGWEHPTRSDNRRPSCGDQFHRTVVDHTGPNGNRTFTDTHADNGDRVTGVTGVAEKGELSPIAHSADRLRRRQRTRPQGDRGPERGSAEPRPRSIR
jgi:hypothetical protein